MDTVQIGDEPYDTDLYGKIPAGCAPDEWVALNRYWTAANLAANTKDPTLEEEYRKVAAKHSITLSDRYLHYREFHAQ